MSDPSAGLLSEKEARALDHAGPARVADYIALLKPRVMSLVVFTGLVGMVCAPGYLHPVLGFVAIFCIAVGAGASGALNMWFDADIDARMSRTRERPIPAGRITPGEALGLGTALSVASVLMMGLFVNVLAAGLLALTIGFYLFVYTMWLKRRTPQNIVIGGAAGALPPVIGWASVTGSLSLEPVLLFAIIFMWTPPHFWALSLFKSDDYERVGVPMMPVVAGDAATRRQIMIYSLILVPLAVTPVLTGLGGWLYGAASIGLGAGFLYFAAKVWTGATGAPMRLFGFSILYLFLLFAALLVEHLIGWV